jgi:hypothetical protein
VRKDATAQPLTGQQRLLLPDAWRRSGLPAGDFAPLVGVSKQTPYAWNRKFQQDGPAGLEGGPRGGPAGSRLPEVTRRAILRMKESHPDWGVEKPFRGTRYAASVAFRPRWGRSAGPRRPSRCRQCCPGAARASGRPFPPACRRERAGRAARR